MADTLQTVFVWTRVAEVSNGSNTILLGTQHAPERDAGLGRLAIAEAQRRRLERLKPPVARIAHGRPVILTDDRAPVELLTDHIVLKELWSGLAFGRST